MDFGEQQRSRSEMSIAPLIDIVFLLLVFFMLAGSFMNLEALDLASPSTAADTGGRSDAGSIVIRLHDDGALSLDNVFVEADEITGRVESAVAENRNLRVVVVSPSQEAVQRLISVVDDVRVAGVQSISVALQDRP